MTHQYCTMFEDDAFYWLFSGKHLGEEAALPQLEAQCEFGGTVGLRKITTWDLLLELFDKAIYIPLSVVIAVPEEGKSP
jgi:hypothetical protein